jgi:hypothetical protein
MFANYSDTSLLASIRCFPLPAFGTPLRTNGSGAEPQELRHYILQSLVRARAAFSSGLEF